MWRLLFPVFVELSGNLLGIGSTCPESHQFAYNNGRECCQTNRETDNGNIIRDPETFLITLDPKCDNSEIRFDSQCCESDDFIECINPPCFNFPDPRDLSLPQHIYANLGFFNIKWTDARDLCKNYGDGLYTLPVPYNQGYQNVISSIGSNNIPLGFSNENDGENWINIYTCKYKNQ